MFSILICRWKKIEQFLFIKFEENKFIKLNFLNKIKKSQYSNLYLWFHKKKVWNNFDKRFTCKSKTGICL